MRYNKGDTLINKDSKIRIAGKSEAKQTYKIRYLSPKEVQRELLFSVTDEKLDRWGYEKI